MYKHWVIGKMYKDLKQDRSCILHAVSPYKRKSGCYLDFKYMDGNFIRQNASKALSRFEMIGEMSQTGTGGYMPAKNITPQIEAFIEATIARPMPTKKASRTKTLVYYANVIYIDFIKKCRIIIK